MSAKRFRVALSFAGQKREYVRQVAKSLARAFSPEAILYDEYHEAEFSRARLGRYLPKLYHEEADLVVVVLCTDYGSKEWCGLEWDAIFDRLQQRDESGVMLCRFDRAQVDGLYSDAGYSEWDNKSPAEAAKLILERLAINERLPRDAYAGNRNRSVNDQVGDYDISRIVGFAPSELFGREAETKILADAWRQALDGERNRPRVIVLVGLGGEGKTSLVAKWAGDLSLQGCDKAFAWSFYSQGTREQLAASSDLFLREALLFFGDAEMADSSASGFDKGHKLATLVGQQQALLILDGLEPLQYAPTSPHGGGLKDHGISRLLKDLATTSQGLCVVTTRYSIPDLNACLQRKVREVELSRLTKPAGVALLRLLEVKGSKAEVEELVEDVKGHALTLRLLGSFLSEAFDGDIRKRDRVRFGVADEHSGGHAFRVIAAYESWLLDGGEVGRRMVAILRLLGLFDRPADAGCIAAIRCVSVPELTDPIVGIVEEDWNIALSRLRKTQLLTTNRDGSLDAHPLIREYFASALRSNWPKAWEAAHSRIYHHLCESTEYRPDTLEGLQPLYQAVRHGCLAGMQEEVRSQIYRDRVLRGVGNGGFYSQKKLGAFASDLGAVACFFDHPWDKVSQNIPERDRGWLFDQAANSLRSLGRLAEAMEPRQAALDAVGAWNWENLAKGTASLSELELVLGSLNSAAASARRSIDHADKYWAELIGALAGRELSPSAKEKLTDAAYTRMYNRALLGKALLLFGSMHQAADFFAEAEEVQTDGLPSYPYLNSEQGFWYCDLLLSQVERRVWRQVLKLGPPQPGDSLAVCRTVTQRAKRTLGYKSWSVGPLATALDNLTLARIDCYSAVVRTGALSPRNVRFQQAVDGLRTAERQDYLPSGLLARAMYRALTGQYTGQDSAQTDLDEAWEIASRGPMPLFLADTHLHRCRLFYDIKPYPWNEDENGNPCGPMDGLREARRLIEKHGYSRRKEELEDAEEASAGW